MLNILSSIKEKALAISFVLVGILAVAASFLLALLQGEKKKAVEQELEDEKNAREQANKGTEALIRGVTDENKPVDNPRDYKF